MLSLLFFGAYLRKLFAAAEPPGHGLLSPLVLAAAVIMAVGAGIDMTISVALVEAVEDIDPAAVQALQALWDNDFMPVAIGIVLLLLSCGLSIVQVRSAPEVARVDCDRDRGRRHDARRLRRVPARRNLGDHRQRPAGGPRP